MCQAHHYVVPTPHPLTPADFPVCSISGGRAVTPDATYPDAPFSKTKQRTRNQYYYCGGKQGGGLAHIIFTHERVDVVGCMYDTGHDIPDHNKETNLFMRNHCSSGTIATKSAENIIVPAHFRREQTNAGTSIVRFPAIFRRHFCLHAASIHAHISQRGRCFPPAPTRHDTLSGVLYTTLTCCE